MGEFSDKVFDAVRKVPRGKVATYGQIARMIGSPRSARYVGYALRANLAPGIDPASIPCHRTSTPHSAAPSATSCATSAAKSG